MRVINYRYSRFPIGRSVQVIKEYINGMIHLRVGDVGVVTDLTIEQLPDFGLFDIRIVHFEFGPHKFGLNEDIAKEYMERML
jgi:hypothetical protein